MSQTRRARPSKPLAVNNEAAFIQTTPPPVEDITKRLEAAQEAQRAQTGPCNYGCSCPACVERQCSQCWVDIGKATESQRRQWQKRR
jgi:hypothetical protein